MKFALIGNIRSEATKGSIGLCPSCGSELVAKCGSFRVHHWAHKTIRNCDSWWENETAWHRNWKSNFPNSWQEAIMRDELSGEKHIADVRTEHGLIIEFQHSAIKPQERIERERFYKNIAWIVDGTRLQKDYTRFLNGKSYLRATSHSNFFFVDVVEECFQANWINSSVPVIFDFKGLDTIDVNLDPRNFLYCLYPKRHNAPALLERIDRQSFVQMALTGEWLTRSEKIMNPQPEPSPTSQKRKIVIRQRESSFILQRGRWIKRKRF